MFATPRTPTHDGEGPPKDQLVGALCVVKVITYDESTPTKYGTSATVKCDLTVVDGPHAGRYADWFAAGNLARQIGEALDVGAMAPCRIESGTSATGRSWYGVTWVTDPADVAAAEAAVLDLIPEATAAPVDDEPPF